MLGDRGVIAAEFCGMMGYKVVDAPACFNGSPLAATLTLQANKSLGERSNRGIVSVSWSDMLDGIVAVFWGTPKVMTILCVIVAVLVTWLYGIY